MSPTTARLLPKHSGVCEMCEVYLVCYEGQTESAYEWVCYSYMTAEARLSQLKAEFPDREWYIVEKDVS